MDPNNLAETGEDGHSQVEVTHLMKAKSLSFTSLLCLNSRLSLDLAVVVLALQRVARSQREGV